jgi:ketosteroid isomerase-like protein
MSPKQKARSPEELDRLFLERAGSGDVEGILDLFEPDAVLAFPPGRLTVGREKMRDIYSDLLGRRSRFEGVVRRALVCGDLALTSTRTDGDATAEVARRQPDGTWLWVIKDPSLLT